MRSEFFTLIEVSWNDVLRKDPRWDKRHNGKYDYIIYKKSDDTYVTSKDGFFKTFSQYNDANSYIDRKTRSLTTQAEMIILGYK